MRQEKPCACNCDSKPFERLTVQTNSLDDDLVARPNLQPDFEGKPAFPDIEYPHCMIQAYGATVI
jgi:hypothetical protein